MSASAPHGPVDEDIAEKQALTDREAGTLLIRDAGSPSDTRWVDDRDDLPKIIRAGRHIARTRRYIRGYAHEIEPEDLVAYVAQEARRGDGWVKLVGDWIDRDLGDLAPCWPREAVEAAIAEAHRLGARVTAHCFAEDFAARPGRVGHRLHRARDGPDRGPDPAVRLARRRDRADAGQHRHLPAASPTGGETRFPRWSAHMRRLHERRYDTVRAAYDAGHPGLRRHGRGRLPAPRAGRRRGRGTGDRGHPARRGARGDELGRPRPGWAAPAWRRARRRTSWSTSPTRGPTYGCWRRRAGWC